MTLCMKVWNIVKETLSLIQDIIYDNNHMCQEFDKGVSSYKVYLYIRSTTIIYKAMNFIKFDVEALYD